MGATAKNERERMYGHGVGSAVAAGRKAYFGEAGERGEGKRGGNSYPTHR